jgi:nitrogen fixation NifU-like protein
VTSSLYRAALLDHATHPRGATSILPGEETSCLVNTACGDEVRWRVAFAPDGTLATAVHDTHGCAICTATASLLAEQVPGLTPSAIRALADDFTTRLHAAAFPDTSPALAALNALAAHPARLSCALLPLHALLASLPNRSDHLQSAP